MTAALISVSMQFKAQARLLKTATLMCGVMLKFWRESLSRWCPQALLKNMACILLVAYKMPTSSHFGREHKAGLQLLLTIDDISAVSAHYSSLHAAIKMLTSRIAALHSILGQMSSGNFLTWVYELLLPAAYCLRWNVMCEECTSTSACDAYACLTWSSCFFKRSTH